MFSLIITIVSIALVAALAVATIYYGGSAHSEARRVAEASTAINAMQQVHAAVTMYRMDKHTLPPDIAALEGDYLRQVPEGDFTFGNDYLLSYVENQDNCEAINKKLEFVPSSAQDTNGNGLPECDNITADIRACCERVTP